MTMIPRPRAAVIRLVLAGAAVAAGLILAAGPAYAHTELVSTSPTEGAVLDVPPRQATLLFNEPVRLVAGAVHVFDAAGTELESSAVAVDATVAVDLGGDLRKGTYVVTWRVVSLDGHPVAGSLTFSVGAPSDRVFTPAAADSTRTWEIVNSVVQGLTYLGLLTATGLLIFWYVVLRGGAPELRERVVRAMTIAAVPAVLGAVLLVPLSAAYQTGESLSSLADSEAWFGGPNRPEVWGALLLVGGVVVARVGLVRWSAPPALVGCVVALGSLALVGHTRSYGPTALVVASDVIHVVTAATWLGGLLGLALSLPHLTGQLGARVVARFSRLAAGLVLLVALTGSVTAWRILRSWSALVDSPFGRLLLVKVTLVALVLALAAWNRYRLVPTIGRLPEDRARSTLGRTVRLEALGLAAVLLLTGFLVERSPTEEPAVVPVTSASAVAGDVRVLVEIDPGTVGANEVLLRLEGHHGGPFEPVALPVLTADRDGLALGEQTLTTIEPGTYRASVVFPRAGHWTLHVSVRVAEFDNPVVDLKVTVGAGD